MITFEEHFCTYLGESIVHSSGEGETFPNLLPFFNCKGEKCSSDRCVECGTKLTTVLDVGNQVIAVLALGNKVMVVVHGC